METETGPTKQTLTPNYIYYMYCWGGFFNEEYLPLHRFDRGAHRFSRKEDRTALIKRMREAEEKYHAYHLMITISEGYTCDIHTILHRVSEFEGQRVYTTYDVGVDYPFDSAHYMMEYKWTPGFNDYPFGELIDYDKVKVIQQWVTGADHDIDTQKLLPKDEYE